MLPGERSLPAALPAAVLQGLADAPRLLSDALHLRATRAAVRSGGGDLRRGRITHGEALSVGQGSIRLAPGERHPPDEAARIARHEALHLLLASTLRGKERWNDPELAFADWIVRGIESGLDAGVPRFQPPLPRLLDPVPTSRLEVQRQLAFVVPAPALARRYFGEALFSALTASKATTARRSSSGGCGSSRPRWAPHYLEAAARLQPEDGAPLHAILLDDWLLDYEQYARAVGNPPSGAGNLWRLSELGWSRDPVTRLSVAAQAMQRDDHRWFRRRPLRPRGRASGVEGARPRPPAALAGVFPAAGGAASTAFARCCATCPKERGRSPSRRRPRADPARSFEARALWPRVLARLLAAELPLPAMEPMAPVVQLVDGEDALQAFDEWKDAAAALRALLREAAGWIPEVARPRHAATLLEAPRAAVSGLLVHAAPLDGRSLLAARAAGRARPSALGALPRISAAGSAYERQPDLEVPLNPRYREEVVDARQGRAADVGRAAGCGG